MISLILAITSLATAGYSPIKVNCQKRDVFGETVAIGLQMNNLKIYSVSSGRDMHKDLAREYSLDIGEWRSIDGVEYLQLEAPGKRLALEIHPHQDEIEVRMAESIQAKHQNLSRSITFRPGECLVQGR